MSPLHQPLAGAYIPLPVNDQPQPRDPDRVILDVLEGNIALLAEKERLEREKLRLQEIDRLKTELLARVSHDLRTPLNSILGFSELLLADAGGRLAVKQTEFVAAIHRNGYALLALINDLLDVAGLESRQMTIRRENLPLLTLLDDVRAATEPQLGASKLAVTWPSRAALADRLAWIDRRRMAQALVNLIDNARKFTPEGGSVVISIEPGAKATIFMVADTGPGIRDEDRSRIFSSFFQRAPAGDGRSTTGVGLGLAIVRGIIDLHEGSIELETASGKGTRFRLTVPHETKLLAATQDTRP